MSKTSLFLFFLGMTTMWTSAAFATEIIAHRGASYVAPENTVISSKKAWELNADAVECDVFLSRDHRVMVNHDETTLRTSGTDLRIANSLSDDLRKLDVGSWKAPEFKGEKIPFLEELLELIPEGKFLFIEFKAGTEVLPALKTIVEKSGKKSSLKYISFDFETICKAKKMMPEVPAYWLLETKKDPKTGLIPPYDVAVLEQVKENNLNGVDVCHKNLDETFVKAVHDQGMKIFVWTVDRPKDAVRLKKIGVDGITTNRSDFIRKALSLVK
ncbi:MAG: glycerophosphodiester phosphodiesterase [Candidatus Ozemobacteraceae bacterium]